MARQNGDAETAIFAQNLRKAQAEAGLSNREVAQALEVSESLLGKWRRGAGKPDLGNAVALARLLGRSVEWFAQDHDEEPVAA